MDIHGKPDKKVGGNVDWTSISTDILRVPLSHGKPGKTLSGTRSRTLPAFWKQWDQRFLMGKKWINEHGPAW